MPFLQRKNRELAFLLLNEPKALSLVRDKNNHLAQKHPAGPLMCWDLFVESHFRRLQQAEGLYSLQSFAHEHRWRVDWDLRRLLIAEEKVALVTDTAQIIRFATPNMIAMNGYTVEEVLGKQPGLFQGKDTD